MSREYQAERAKAFVLPFSVYMQTLWCVRDYERLKEINNQSALKRKNAIDRALDEIPESYREGIMKNILFRANYGDFAHENTWKLWKQRFVYYAANYLGINIRSEADEFDDIQE